MNMPKQRTLLYSTSRLCSMQRSNCYVLKISYKVINSMVGSRSALAGAKLFPLLRSGSKPKGSRVQGGVCFKQHIVSPSCAKIHIIICNHMLSNYLHTVLNQLQGVDFVCWALWKVNFLY